MNDQDQALQYRASAAAIIPDIIAAREEKLAEFQKFHEDDCAKFSFRCERFGDFLSVFVARGPKRPSYFTPYDAVQYSNKTAASINMMATRAMTIYAGSVPDMAGKVRFVCTSGNGVAIMYDDGAVHQFLTLVADQSPRVPHRMAMHMQSSNDYLHGMHVPDCPRAAVDDRIYFQGSGMTLFAPAGLGQSVYDAILKACADAAP